MGIDFCELTLIVEQWWFSLGGEIALGGDLLCRFEARGVSVSFAKEGGVSRYVSEITQRTSSQVLPWLRAL